TMPVTKPEAGESNQSIVPSKSSGSPKRPIGVWLMMLWPRAVSLPVASSVNRKRFCSVKKKPGAMALTRMRGEYSCARCTASHCVKLLRSEEHTSELQSQSNLVCRLLLEKKKQTRYKNKTSPE